MLRPIFIALGIFVALALVAMWVFSGGFGRIKEHPSEFTNFFGLPSAEHSDVGSTRWLPWKVTPPQGPDISWYAEGQTGFQSEESELKQIQTELDLIESSLPYIER